MTRNTTTQNGETSIQEIWDITTRLAKYSWFYAMHQSQKDKVTPAIENTFIYLQLLRDTGQDPATATHSIRAFKHLYATDVLHSLRPPNYISLSIKKGTPPRVPHPDLTVCLHWFFKAPVLHFIRFIPRRTCISVPPFTICQQRCYREGSNLPDQAQNIWKSETRQSLAMKQVPKEPELTTSREW